MQILKKIFSIKKYNMFQFQIPDQQVIQKTYQQINQKLIKSYNQPLMKKYLNSLPSKTLLNQSVVMFVGSRSRPKNQTLTKQLIRLAGQKAELNQIKLKQQIKKYQEQKIKNKQKQSQQQQQIVITNSQKDMVKFYSSYFIKMSAMQTGNQKHFDQSSMFLIDLAQKGHALSSFMIGKQLYKMTQTMEDKNQINDTLLRALSYFQKSVTEHNLNGLLYIAQILQQYPQLQSTQEQIQQLYTYSAAYGNPLACFKLANIYKKKKHIKLYMKYLKMAAQGGVIQAQHNLAIQYLEGKNILKDQLKAFAWFIQAGAHNFIYSKYNAALILKKGSQCGKIKPNKKAALIYLQQINRTGQLDVKKQIQEILSDSIIKKQLQEEQQLQKKQKIINQLDINQTKKINGK